MYSTNSSVTRTAHTSAKRVITWKEDIKHTPWIIWGIIVLILLAVALSVFWCIWGYFHDKPSEKPQIPKEKTYQQMRKEVEFDHQLKKVRKFALGEVLTPQCIITQYRDASHQHRLYMPGTRFYERRNYKFLSPVCDPNYDHFNSCSLNSDTSNIV